MSNNNDNVVPVLLPTGAKLPMRSHVSKAGKQGHALLCPKKDGTRWLNPTGVNIEALAQHPPRKVTVLGQDVEVSQRIGFFVDTGRVSKRDGQPIMEWIDDPAGEPEVNSQEKPVFRGKSTVIVDGKEHTFNLRITDFEDGRWNASAGLWAKADKAKKVFAASDL